MAIDPGVLGAGEPVRPARPLVVSRTRTARRIVVDRWASRLVVSGGIIIIASILAILFVIAAEVYPLFKPPTTEFLGTRSPVTAGGAPAPGAAAGMDEYLEVGYTVGTGGVLELVGLKGDRRLAGVAIPGLDGARVSTVAGLGKGRHLIGTTDGRVIPLDMRFERLLQGREARGDARAGVHRRVGPGSGEEAATAASGRGGAARRTAHDRADRSEDARDPSGGGEEGAGRRQPAGGIAHDRRRPDHRRGHGAGARRESRGPVRRHVDRRGHPLRHARSAGAPTAGPGRGHEQAGPRGDRAGVPDR